MPALPVFARPLPALRLPVATTWLLGTLLAFACTPALDGADSVARGTVSGRVLDEVTGLYLNNARVAVAGTDLVAFTDQAGAFRLADVPSGPIVLRVFHTGLAPLDVPLQVPAGGNVEREISLPPAGVPGAAPSPGGVVKLDAFTVLASRETNAEAIAIQEQRFAPNLKNVVAADAFGEIYQGNIGEFIKYLPGVDADFADPNIISISVRGLDSHLTQVTSDGARLASAHTGGSTRVFQFDQVSLNNVARVELTKVPTPADPADSLGGIVNLVGKSAFERRQRLFEYRVFAAARHDHLTLERQPDPHDGRRHRVLPNADFTYSVPVSPRFGLVVAGLSANSFDERRVAARTYNTSLAGSGASITRPFLQTFTLQDAPRFIYRTSGSLKADWRVTPAAVLSANVEHSRFLQYFGMNQLLVNTGANATPTPASGQPLTFGPDFTRGAAGRGALSLNGQHFNIRGATTLGSVRYRFDDGRWQIRANASASTSKTRFTDTEDGHFYNTTTQMQGSAGFVGSLFTVNHLDIGHTGPRTIDIRDAQNAPVDLARPGNYRLFAGASLPRDVANRVQSVDAAARRRISRAPFPLALGSGAALRTQKNDTRMQNQSWTYLGPDGNAATNDPATPYLADPWTITRDSGFGHRNIPWVSPTRAYAAWRENPRLFTQTVAQQVAAENYRIDNSEAFSESVSAAFLEADARLFRGRLRVLTGVRYEHTVGQGQGALLEPAGVWVRNADGSFARNAAGNRIRKPEAGAVGSLEELRVTLFERAARARRTYDGYYPSLHLTYNVTANFLARAAYARTYGRPNFNQIIPNATINDFDVSDPGSAGPPLGTIEIRNPALRPWQADNFDVSFEYYTERGGLLSAGFFRKNIDGFHQRRIAIATAEDLAAVDLDDRYVGYQLNTTYNLGRGHTTGVELGVRHPLAFLGSWGRPFEAFANTTLVKEINGTHGKQINAGLTFRRRPVTMQAKVNYRGENRGATVAGFGPDAYQYEGARTTVDLNVTYLVSPRLSLFASASNALNDHPSADRRGSQTPEYAWRFREQRFGALYSLGLRGSF